MALFGAPIAHEDHAQRACYAALALRDAVREHAEDVRVRYGVPFGVRIGLNSGEVVVGKIGDDLRMDYTAQGHTVGLAQRMEALAESGHICLSEHTARLVTGYFQLQGSGSDQGQRRERAGRALRSRGGRPVSHPPRPFAGAWAVYLCRPRQRDGAARGGAPARFGGAGADRRGGGRGRVGKSRLCFEFTERCRARGIAVHQAHCPAHGKTVAHLPVLELLRGYFGLADGDSPRAAREKIAGRLLLLDRAFDSALPLIWDFLRVPDPERPVEELDPTVRQQQLHDFFRRLARARSEREPAVLFFRAGQPSVAGLLRAPLGWAGPRPGEGRR
jgi:Adenylate and Guanylate cyclase catalytic domain